MGPMATPEEINSSADALRELARSGNSGHSLPLPPLKQQSLLPESWIEWAKKTVQGVFDWIEKYLPSSAKLDPATVQKTIYVVIWGLALGLIVLALFWLIRMIVNRKSGPPKWTASHVVSQVTEDDWLTDQLRAALEEKEFSRASRLRWRIFLRRKNQRPSVTLREYGLKNTEAYKLMFFKVEGAEDAYRTWDDLLTGLEHA